jgi:signal transduction histidine kinase
LKVGTRFIIALLLVLLPVMGGYMYWNVHRSTQSYIHDLERESRATTRSLRAAIEDDIRANEWDQVQDIFERVRTEGSEAAVFTVDGKLWFALPSFPERLKTPPMWPQPGQAKWPFEFRVDFGSNGEWICDLVRLGAPKHPLFGYLLVANDFSDVRRDLRERVRISIIAGIVTLLIMVALIAVAVRRYISRPLDELSRRVMSFSTETSSRIPVGDEVELLIGEFRKLGEELGKARADLLEKHRSEIELERRLLHSDRLATIGSLAAGLAHEIGTPMGVIRGRAEYVLHSGIDSHRTSEGLEIIIAQIDRITSIVRMLLDYSRYREPLKMTADLRPVVQRSIRLLETEAGKRGVRISTELGERPLLCDCDPNQLQQVFVNLGINALDAMRAGGGTLTVTERTVAEPAGHITIIFADNGPGIPEQHRGRVFDPFFTTKDPGEGTGMGLAICQTIIQGHRGEIRFESGPTGTRFFVTLPVSDRSLPDSIDGARVTLNGHN